MNIKIPPDLETIISLQLSSGRFARAEDVVRAALVNLRDLVFFDPFDESPAANASRGGVQPGKTIVERLPEFFTSSDEFFVPADVPMPRGQIIQPVKGGKRLPEFHGTE